MDKIANFINKLKMASAGKKPSFQFPATRLVTSIAEALKRTGYLGEVGHKGKLKETLELSLLYRGGKPKVRGARRISHSSKRLYSGAKKLRPVRQGFGTAFLSTPKGILPDTEARQQNVGGEVLFEIW